MSEAEEKLTAIADQLSTALGYFSAKAKAASKPNAAADAILEQAYKNIASLRTLRLSRPPAVTRERLVDLIAGATDADFSYARAENLADTILPLLSGATVAVDQWRPITKDDRKADKILTPEGYMKWIEGDDFALWIWDDSLLADADPDPPQPELCFDLPPVPIASGLLGTKGEG